MASKGESAATEMAGAPAAERSNLHADDAADSGGYDYDADTLKALVDMDSCQNEMDSLNEKAFKEIRKVEQKYNKLCKPHFEKRNDSIKNVPNFWVTAFVNHPLISAVLDEEEEECLHYLSKVEVEEFDDIEPGYRIKFHFDENPFFGNDVLTKEFFMGTAEPQSTSTQIDWKEGMDLLKRSQAADAKDAKKRAWHMPPRTFFAWFSDNGDAITDDIAEVIKDDLWPNPLQYFLMPVVDMDEDGLEGDDSDDSDDSDDDVVVFSDPEDDDYDDYGADDDEGDNNDDDGDNDGDNDDDDGGAAGG